MITNSAIKPKFPLGRVLATPGALAALADSSQLPREFLRRHALGDWGELSDADTEANEEGLVHDDRLLSSYRTRLGVRIWIITEADRSSTTLLLPEEY
ncbi:MAG: hypothetical protein FJ276_21130 [Planctomycetes bacterium]|nr:hypothetical protein [Planctomycetota bacterium]